MQYRGNYIKLSKIVKKELHLGPSVVTYTNEGLCFGIALGPLKFEPHKRGPHPKLPVTTI